MVNDDFLLSYKENRAGFHLFHLLLHNKNYSQKLRTKGDAIGKFPMASKLFHIHESSDLF